MYAFHYAHQSYLKKGWCKIAFDDELKRWVNHVFPIAKKIAASAEHANWLRYGNTWFAGVNLLPNDQAGRVLGSGKLSGKCITFVHDVLKLKFPCWDSAQISICYPGYPKPDKHEPKTAFQYRLKRAAAHVDGLHPIGENRNRFLREHHAFILGIALNDFSEEAAPFTVWEGSHHVILKTLLNRYDGIAYDEWKNEDITEVYNTARKKIFEQCNQREIHVQPGEAFIAHRLVLHGMAPWRDHDNNTKDGRMMCYFRPELAHCVNWLKLE